MMTVGKEQIRAAGRFLGQSVMSLAFDMGGLVAGTILAAFLGAFSTVPWAVLVFPGILSIRGAVGGLFSGRLSTALHIGSIRPSFLHNTREYYDLIQSVVVLTLVSGVSMAAMASVFSAALLGTTIADSLTMILVVIATMGLSLFVISPITIGVSIVSVRRGLDPDVITYPIVSTVADILVTACYVMILSANAAFPFTLPLLAGGDLLFAGSSVLIIMTDRRKGTVRTTLKQFLGTLAIVVVIVNVTGSFLDRISRVVSERPELYMVYPALIDTVGDVGSIVGSTTTTGLTMGTLPPTLTGIKKQTTEVAMAWLASMIMFGVYCGLATLYFGLTPAAVLGLLGVLLTANLLSVLCVSIFAYVLAIVTVKRGLNPDNFVIPVESSVADTVTTIAILFALTVLS
ncbi:MAG: hypothetical protein DRO93_01650 [Candidatus Thorarchaeota archaeon]|nr:MAG: hypothetical protein DRO93_01650 [Candidatus Thorarchaeota archaeon]